MENSTQNNEHMIWWSSLSINEQKYYISLHPFFSLMGNYYFNAHKNAIKEVYENTMFNNLFEKYETVCDIFRELNKKYGFLISSVLINETVSNHIKNKLII